MHCFLTQRRNGAKPQSSKRLIASNFNARNSELFAPSRLCAFALSLFQPQ